MREAENMMNKEWWKNIPVSINNAFGDPFTELQIEDTIYKLNSLQSQNAPYSVITKAVINDEIYNKLKQVKTSKNLVVIYSLTGLDEGGFSFEERVNTIHKLKEIFGEVIVLVRPIIPGKNDDLETLEKIVLVAKSVSNRLITGAIHNEFKRKKVDADVREMLVQLCEKHGVKYYHKSSCAAADISNNPCWMHDLGKPINLDVVKELGYNFTLDENGGICLDKATVGDLNFLRMITKSYITAKEIISGYNILSISSDMQTYEVSSSWFSWSRNRRCSINCNYCIIHSIEYLNEDKTIGVHPSEIMDRSVKACDSPIRKKQYKKGKYVAEKKNNNMGYNDLRSIQQCRVLKYV